MKTKILLTVLALGLIISVFGQKAMIELTFTAENQGQYVQLDSILIENFTQSADTTLYAPDTVLALVFHYVSISDNEPIGKNNFTVSQNYPNPFNDQTTINIYMPEKEKIEISIRDILGRELGYYENILNKGNHKFTFYPGNEKFYLCIVNGEHASHTIKMINASNSAKSASQCKIIYTSCNETKSNFKHQKANNNFVFYPGDELRYTGFAKTIIDANGSDIIEDAPEANELYEFDITEGIPCPGMPTITYGLKVYNTVLIGSQCWLKESLNIGTMIFGVQSQLDNGTIEKYCFDDNPSNCNTYGGLYQWGEAMNYSSQIGAQGICPSGWHIPSDEEWKQLEGEVDTQYGYPDPEWDGIDYRGFDVGERLKSQSSWENNGNGTDFFGFSALATGARRFDGVFLSTGIYSGIWSSTEADPDGPWYRYMESYSSQVARTHNLSSMGRPVRCVLDE